MNLKTLHQQHSERAETMSNTKMRRNIVFAVVAGLLVLGFFTSCRTGRETDSELKPKRRTVLIDADSFSPGAYLPFNTSCFDCFLFPTYDVNGVYLDFAPASYMENRWGDPTDEIRQVNGIHCFLVSPRLHQTNGLFLGAVSRPKTFVSGVSLIGAGTGDFPFSVNLIRQDGVSFSLFGAPLECNGVSFSLLGAPIRSNGVSFSLLGICRRQRQGVYCSLLNYSYAADWTEEDDPQSVVQFGLFNSCRSGVQIGLFNYNENALIPFLPFFNFSRERSSEVKRP